MATILFTDIVDSTVRARTEGDAAWKHTLAMHEDVVRTVLPRFGGREVETAGDSFLIVFDGAERAIRCGLELVDALAAIRLSIRVGIHSGEVTLSGERVGGVAVHVAARILAEAGTGDVLLSGTTRDQAEGGAGLGVRVARATTASRVWSGSTSCSQRHFGRVERHCPRQGRTGALAPPSKSSSSSGLRIRDTPSCAD